MRFEAAALVLASVLTLMLGVPDVMLRDPDTFWHIATGQQIWATGAVPRADSFSHTFTGSPWAAKEWLAQLALYGAYSLAGWAGVAGLAALAMAGAFALLFTLLLRHVRPAAAVLLTLAAFCSTMQMASARPQLLALPLLVLWAGEVARAVDEARRPPLWLLPLMALWANLHASFPIAFVLAACLGAEACLAAAPGRRVRTVAGWAAFGLAALAATAATPYGMRAALVPLMVVGGNEAVPYINEWRPARLDAWTVVAMAVLAAALGVALARKATAPRSVPVLLCAVLSLKHLRFIPHAAVAAVLLMAGPLGRLMPGLAPRPLHGGVRWRGRLRASLAGLLLAGGLLFGRAQPQPDPSITPSAALRAAQQAGLSGPAYNSYDFGGFLVLNGVKTFIDGRTDQLFLGGFMAAIMDAEGDSGDEKLLALLDRYKVEWAIVKVGEGASAKLRRAPGWREIHRDAVAAVYARNG